MQIPRPTLFPALITMSTCIVTHTHMDSVTETLVSDLQIVSCLPWLVKSN